MTIKEILELMDEMLDSALALPLSGGKCMINADKFRQLIADISVSLPKEFEEANRIVQDRQRIIDEAKREAATKVKMAEERARRLVDEAEITRKIKEKASDVISLTQAQTKELKIAANEFSENILKTTEQGLVESLKQIRNARAALKNPQSNNK